MARGGSKIEHTFPTRGVPGGWRDPWEVDDSAELRARAEAVERRQDAQARQLGRYWHEDGRDEGRERASGATSA